jgi:hypothetical protein
MEQIVRRHDDYVEKLLKQQETDPASRWRGTFPDEFELYFRGTAAGIIDALTAAYLHPGSRFHNNPELPGRIKLAGDFLAREQTPDGNWDLPITNFNSPPDTAFIIRALSPAAVLLKRADRHDLFSVLEPVLRKGGQGLVKGGIHTPNHRWVACGALAQLYELFGDPAYVRRVDQWLAEGIDIDPDGQYTERSTYAYNPITNNALTTVAVKLNRPALLDPVRKNLESMLYLLHPGYEVITEISRRQDLNQRGDMGPYWFSLAHLAHHLGDGRFATLAAHFAPSRAGLSSILEYPALQQPLPELAAIPEDYARVFPHNGLVHVRRRNMSAVILAGGRNRFFTFRVGNAVINAVRFASAFFGKAQFNAKELQANKATYRLVQKLQAPYYQPLNPPRNVNADEWEETRPGRRQTEINHLTQSVTARETRNGFELRIQASGTTGVPLAIEINFREGGKLEGVVPAHKVEGGWLLAEGDGVYRFGTDAIRFGPGIRSHLYTQVRGAEPKLPGPSVYLTAYTPFDQVLRFERV